MSRGAGICSPTEISDAAFEKPIRYRLGGSERLFNSQRTILPNSLRREVLKKIKFPG